MAELVRVRPLVAFSIVSMPLCTSSRDRWLISNRVRDVSATL